MPYRTSSTDYYDSPRQEYCAFCRHRSNVKCCPWCEKEFRAWAVPLAHNLAVAAGLCRAFDLGSNYGRECLRTALSGEGWTYPFTPGCEKAAL